ncbi:MAG TPA: hypothetical protein VFM13_13540 [Gaiellaceae bacterium]|nr:hypothetical protein [Gaiellaceae bacterium]
MRVQLSDSACLPPLVDDLLRGGCLPTQIDETTLEVFHPLADDPEEARVELAFFLRAWESAHPGVELTLAA